MSVVENKIIAELDKIYNELVTINAFMYRNPELGNEEFKASMKHVELLIEHGFQVEEGFLNIKTAYKGVYDSGKPGPVIGFMSEYDALQEIGHGCGHNLIGAVSLGSSIVLSKLLNEIGGKVILYGTPAEETDGAKVDMAEAGVFDEVDVVMIAHPADKTYVSIGSLAMEAIEFEFGGKPAHAAACPEKGINALDAVIGTFNSINALREHITQETRIHGIITKGGIAANIVPELAVAQFYVRATSKTYLNEVVEKVKNCARGAALATGATLSINNYEKSYDNFVRNEVFNRLITDAFESNGVKNVATGNAALGSVDAGNVSQVCPVVHPMFAITEGDVAIHSREFADLTIEPFALDAMERVIKSFVEVSCRLIEEPSLIKEIKDCFDHTTK